MLPLPPLRFEDLLPGSEPVLFVLAGFTTTAFIQFVGPHPYHYLVMGQCLASRQVARGALRAAESLRNRLFVRIGIDHGYLWVLWTKRNVLQIG